jgi:hypothetical protein
MTIKPNEWTIPFDAPSPSCRHEVAWLHKHWWDREVGAYRTAYEIGDCCEC